MKTCFKCKTKKPLSEFYKHGRMADGHLGKCKDCTKKDVTKNYFDKHEHYAEYERERFQRPERKADILIYQRDMRLREPEKYQARMIAGNAVRDGKLKKQVCKIKDCDCMGQMHHEDYSKPLEVTWLCREHHMIHEGKIPF